MSRQRRTTGSPRLSLRRWGTVAVIVLFSWALASPERYFFPNFANTAADDATYVAYAMSIALDGDLDFSNEIAARLTTYPNGLTRPVHPAGPGIMAAPIVAVLSVWDRVSGHPVIDDREQLGGSWSYFGYFIASAGALIGGLLLASRTALAMTRSLSPLFLILVLAGTGLPFYGLRRFTMGHSFEFLAVTMVLWAVVRLRQSDRPPLPSMLLLSTGVALSLLVRPANVNIVLLPVIVHLLFTLVPRAAEEKTARTSASRWLAGGTVLGLTATFATNAFLYGTPYPSFGQQYGSTRVQAPEGESSRQGLVSAATEFFADTIPRAMTALSRVSDIPTVLFTQEYGLVWFMPIVPVGGLLLVVSLIVLWRRRERRFAVVLVTVLSVAYATVPLGVVLVWQSHASSFGFRYLFSLVPLGLLGLALWAALPDRPSMTPLRPVLGMLTMFALLSLFAQAFHGTSPTLSHYAVQNSFGRADTYGNPTFASALLAAMVQPDAWANMIARGLPGFAGLTLLPIGGVISLAVTAGVVPQRRADTLVDLVAEYASELTTAAPGTTIATLVVFGALVPAVIARITRRPSVCRAGPEDAKSTMETDVDSLE